MEDVKVTQESKNREVFGQELETNHTSLRIPNIQDNVFNMSSNTSTVSLPVKRISQEDWPNIGIKGNIDDHPRLIPSFSTKKIRQILMASRRSNSLQRNDNTLFHNNEQIVGNFSRTSSQYVPSPSIRSIDSVNGISNPFSNNNNTENNQTFTSNDNPEKERMIIKNVHFDQENNSNASDDYSSLQEYRIKSRRNQRSNSSLNSGNSHFRNIDGKEIQLSQLYISQGQCHMDILKEEIHLMEQLEQGVLIFNNSPEEGISYMIENQLIEDDPLYIANFLLHTDFLDKKKVGELLGGHSNFSLSILNNYVHLFNTNSLEPDVALRYFLSRFFLPGESQMVYRILERFSVSYVRDNPNTLYTSDQIHTLCYALVMLNTSLHNSHVRTKMTKNEFTSMCMLSSLPATSSQLETMYDRVSENELKPFLSPSEKVYGRLSRDPKVLRSRQVSKVNPSLLQKGTVFRRFYNRRNSHTIIAWVSSDSNFFCWKKVRSKSSNILNPGSFVENMNTQFNRLINFNKKYISNHSHNLNHINLSNNESQSCILTRHSKITKRLRKIFNMDYSDLSCILLDDIIDINVGITSNIHLNRQFNKILYKNLATSYSNKTNINQLQSELESRCFSIITRTGESIDLCSLDSTHPSLLTWVRFFHQTILKNQEFKESNQTNMVINDHLDQDRGIESDLLRVWYHGIFIQWENHWSLSSYINLSNSKLPNMSIHNHEYLSSGSNGNNYILKDTSTILTNPHNHNPNIFPKYFLYNNTNKKFNLSRINRNTTWIQKNRNKNLILYPNIVKEKNKSLFKFKNRKLLPPNNNLHNKFINYQAPISHLILHLWGNNIPYSYRGILWNISIGNRLQINEDVFNNLLLLRENFLLNINKSIVINQDDEQINNLGGPMQEAFIIHLKRFHKDIVNVFSEFHSYFIGAGAVLGYKIWERRSNFNNNFKDNSIPIHLVSLSNSNSLQKTPLIGIQSPISSKTSDRNNNARANEMDSEVESLLMFMNDNSSIYRIDESTRILVECFILYRPDIGYVEGMSHIAIILLLFNINILEAFKTFTNLLHSCYFLDLFLLNHRNVKMRLDFFDLLLREIMPSLARHFDVLSITSDTYIMSWFTSLFSTCLPIQIIPKIWDSLFLFGEPYAFQVAAAVLKYHEHKLITTSFEGCISILHSVPNTFDYRRFNNTIEQFNGMISNRFGLWLAAQRLSEQKTDLLEELL